VTSLAEEEKQPWELMALLLALVMPVSIMSSIKYKT
jgi:hypothetical protein